MTHMCIRTTAVGLAANLAAGREWDWSGAVLALAPEMALARVAAQVPA